MLSARQRQTQLLFFLFFLQTTTYVLARDPLSISTNIEQHRAAFTSGICRGLHEDYSKLHADILSGKLPPRYVVFISPPSGIADRLLGLVSAFYMALVQQRALLIAPHPMSYELLYDQPFINWTTPAISPTVAGPALWPPQTRECSSCDAAAQLAPGGASAHMNCAVCSDDGPGRSAAYLNWVNVATARAWHMVHNLSALYPTANYIYVSGNRGTSVGMFHNVYHQRALRALGLRASTAFGCAINYLLFPKPETLEVVKEEMDAVLAAPLVFGIQIRTDDKYMAGQAELSESYAAQYRYMFECAAQMERALGITEGGPIPVAPKWFLVSDSMVVRQQAQLWYPNKTIVYMRSKPRHVSDSAAGDMHASRLAAAEHWVFGMTDYQVIHWWSGYGRTAAMRAMRETGVHALEAKKDDCSIENSEDVWQLGTGYSGARRRRQVVRRR